MMNAFRFVADTMLGSLAKWLRALGYDTHYQRYYPSGAIDALVKEGRVLLTRHRKRADQAGKTAVFIQGDRVGDQLNGLAKVLSLTPPPTKWFTRCLLCNSDLQEAHEREVSAHVPEYVFYQNAHQIRFCPTCGRYFWPGSHRTNMESQLRKWGFGHVPKKEGEDTG